MILRVTSLDCLYTMSFYKISFMKDSVTLSSPEGQEYGSTTDTDPAVCPFLEFNRVTWGFLCFKR